MSNYSDSWQTNWSQGFSASAGPIPVNAGPVGLLPPIPTDLVLRIDNLFLVLSYSAVDLNTSAEICIGGDGSFQPILSVAGWVASLDTPGYQNKYCASLETPFYATGGFELFVRGESDGGGSPDSSMTAVVFYSTAWNTLGDNVYP